MRKSGKRDNQGRKGNKYLKGQHIETYRATENFKFYGLHIGAKLPGSQGKEGTRSRQNTL